MKKFNILNVSSKFAICGVPLRADTYKNCSFGCIYCFADNRVIMNYSKDRQVGDINQLERTLKRLFEGEGKKEGSFLDALISERITWHVGGMSDPFQHCEKELGITKQMVELGNKYNISMLFSTKSDTVYDTPIDPKLHSFQLSFSSLENSEIEPNIPSTENRIAFYHELKSRGFKVGIRLQPFIPNLTTLEIVKKFKDADHFTIEGLKLVPQNSYQNNIVLDKCCMKKEDFTQMGLLNLKPNIREVAYAEFISYFEDNNISYSIADNDMHDIGTSKCCCGDSLVDKSTDFNNTSLIKKYGLEWTDEEAKNELGCFKDCKANMLFTSNRTEGCTTVCDFIEKRHGRKTSPFSPKFLYVNKKIKSIADDIIEDVIKHHNGHMSFDWRDGENSIGASSLVSHLKQRKEVSFVSLEGETISISTYS